MVIPWVLVWYFQFVIKSHLLNYCLTSHVISPQVQPSVVPCRSVKLHREGGPTNLPHVSRRGADTSTVILWGMPRLSSLAPHLQLPRWHQPQHIHPQCLKLKQHQLQWTRRSAYMTYFNRLIKSTAQQQTMPNNTSNYLTGGEVSIFICMHNIHRSTFVRLNSMLPYSHLTHDHTGWAITLHDGDVNW